MFLTHTILHQGQVSLGAVGDPALTVSLGKSLYTPNVLRSQPITLTKLLLNSKVR